MYTNKKGLSSAIAIVITIVVLLIIALAVIGVSTGAIGKLGQTVSGAPGGDDLLEYTCSSQITEEACNAIKGCAWIGDRCVVQ